MKKEKRSLFNIVFGKKQKPVLGTFLRLMSGFDPVFSNVGDNIYDSNIARECINTIATHGAKMLPQHIQKQETTQNINGEINYLLSIQPNPIMTTYDFLYKTISILYASNNVFIYIDKDKDGMIKGFYPLHPDNCELYEKNNKIYIAFRFTDGDTYFTEYEQVVHLRRFFNIHDFYGDTNNVLSSAIETANTATEGIRNAIKTTTALQGIIKYSSSMLKAKDIKKARDEFVEDFINNNKGKGIAGLDAKADFKELNLKPITLDKDQLSFVNNNVFDYFGISEKIVRSDFTDEEWNAFYESVIEPLAIQMSNAFTVKIFSKLSIRDGHQIVFNVNRIKYAKTETKISLLKETAVLGLYTIDEAREVLDLPPIGGEEGKKRLQTLNVINQDIADKYQGGKKNEKENTGNKNDGNESNTK